MIEFLQGDHVSFDIETLSRRSDAAIVSIGAVEFTFDEGIKREFTVNISAKSCKELGMNIDPETVDWWWQQPKEVRQMWMDNPFDIKDALDMFDAWFGNGKHKQVWCMGAGFDYGILRFPYYVLGREIPWKYWNENDQRTIYNFLGVRNNQLRSNDKEYHSALADARSQALSLIELLKD